MYSLAAAAANVDYESRQRLKRESAGVPTGVPVSEALSPRGMGANRASAVSGGSGGDVAGNRLSETAFFSPRPGDSNQGVLGVVPTDPPDDRYCTYRPVSKTRSATVAMDMLTDDTLSGSEHRSHTNVVAYGSSHQRPLGGREVLSNGYMKPNSGDSVTSHSTLLRESPPPEIPPQNLDLEEGYGFLSKPPPIDRSNKPPEVHTPPPPVVDRALKPGRITDLASSDSSEGSPPERHGSLHDSTPYTKLPSGSTGTEEAAKEESESQFTFSEIPQVTVRTTHYIQVDFNPDTRRPMPIPRKTFTTSGGGTPTSLVPKPRRVNYTHVDIHATNKLADHLQRQMTVREAEQKVLATKQYVNIDHSGTVDDDTDPDYYTHMRVCRAVKTSIMYSCVHVHVNHLRYNVHESDGGVPDKLCVLPRSCITSSSKQLSGDCWFVWPHHEFSMCSRSILQYAITALDLKSVLVLVLTHLYF